MDSNTTILLSIITITITLIIVTTIFNNNVKTNTDNLYFIYKGNGDLIAILLKDIHSVIVEDANNKELPESKNVKIKFISGNDSIVILVNNEQEAEELLNNLMED